MTACRMLVDIAVPPRSWPTPRTFGSCGPGHPSNEVAAHRVVGARCLGPHERANPTPVASYEARRSATARPLVTPSSICPLTSSGGCSVAARPIPRLSHPACMSTPGRRVRPPHPDCKNSFRRPGAPWTGARPIRHRVGPAIGAPGAGGRSARGRAGHEGGGTRRQNDSEPLHRPLPAPRRPSVARPHEPDSPINAKLHPHVHAVWRASTERARVVRCVRSVLSCRLRRSVRTFRRARIVRLLGSPSRRPPVPVCPIGPTSHTTACAVLRL